MANSVNEFFSLKAENQLLNEENVRLKNILESKNNDVDKDVFSVIDTLLYTQKYEYLPAKIINNNFSRRNNTLTINKGSKLEVTPDLGVINSKGIIGVVKDVSLNYATVLSILNSNSKINIRLKKNNHFGTLTWDGKDYNITQITDIPRQAVINIGDTIITGGKSAIFPEGIHVGKVKDFKFENNQYVEINVVLFNDMSALGYVQVIKNLQRKEQLNLEQKGVNE